MISGAGALVIVGILLLVNATRDWHHAGIYEKVGKGMDESLSESKAKLDKSTDLVLRALNHAKIKKELCVQSIINQG
jgi:hypothetical protein